MADPVSMKRGDAFSRAGSMAGVIGRQKTSNRRLEAVIPCFEQFFPRNGVFLGKNTPFTNSLSTELSTACGKVENCRAEQS